MKLVDPLFLVKSLPNAGLCSIAIQHRTLGPNANITNGSVSGLQAVIAAVEAIRRGDADIALAGGYDSLLRMDCIADHLISGRLASYETPQAATAGHFDRARSGYAVSEGAAFLALETEEHARRRSARIYGEVCSFGQTASPRALVDPAAADARPLAAAVNQAMAAANLDVRRRCGLRFRRWHRDVSGRRAGGPAYEALFNGAQPRFSCHTGLVRIHRRGGGCVFTSPRHDDVRARHCTARDQLRRSRSGVPHRYCAHGAHCVTCRETL